MSSLETTHGTTKQSMLLRDLRWPFYVAVVLSIALMVQIYHEVFQGWYRTWMQKDSYYSHGILVPFISLFVVWLKRKELAEIPLRPSALGWPLLALALLLQLASYANSANSVQGLTVPLVLIGAVLVLFGVEMTRALLFPLVFLFFMCVLPGDILTRLSFRIQLTSTTLAAGLLNLLGFMADQDGTSIRLSNVSVEVGAPCSGFRMLISLVAFAFLFAYLKQGPTWGRVSLVAVAVPLSLIVNAVRVTLIAVVGDSMGSEAMHKFHDYSGYIVLIIAFLVLTQVARLVKCGQFKPILTSS